MTDYERIACAIRFASGRRSTALDLSQLAAEAGLDPLRFHRLFRTWAGATPKDLLHCLTLSHARECLKDGQEALLSQSGNLQSPCSHLAAATPEEIKTRGAALVIRAGVTASPFGNCLIGQSQRGVCHLSFFDAEGRKDAIRNLRADWPKASLQWDDEHADHLAETIFHSPPGTMPAFKLHVRGTPFQIQIWQTLLRVPFGTLVSYGMLATAAGSPHAARAAGTAVGRNAISFLIPCHRVIRDTGIPGHYRWGAVRKHTMLAWENARKNPA